MYADWVDACDDVAKRAAQDGGDQPASGSYHMGASRRQRASVEEDEDGDIDTGEMDGFIENDEMDGEAAYAG